MHVAELHIYPVKSLSAVTLKQAQVEYWGLRDDRRYMVVRPDGIFLTQRELPGMALIRPSLLAHGLRLETPASGSIEVSPGRVPLDVVVWKDSVRALACGEAADRWLSEVLKTPCRLAYLDDPTSRKIADRWRLAEESVSFADGFPALLTSFGSLDDLNTRLETPIRINRFRGNIVAGGVAPWAEDGWARIQIGPVVFRVAKPCERCIVTTIEQETAERRDKTEPLRTLGTFRRDPRGVMFGQNLIPLTTGEIRVGDRIEILEQGPSNVALP